MFKKCTRCVYYVYVYMHEKDKNNICKTQKNEKKCEI